jgi:spermidine synthase
MYHVVGTALTITLLYLISFFFYRTGIYSQAFHRKLWNSVLAIAFLFTAIAGIFMALQINFKWNVPFIKSLLKWHVETGVALGFTGLFHFLWHLSYFRNILKISDSNPGLSFHSLNNDFSISVNLFMIGFTSTSVQILLMRELMNIAGGYELISGVFLGSWLITSSAGAAIATRSVLCDIRKINLLFAVGPFISLLLLVINSKLLLSPGEVPSFLEAMIFTLILVSPFCLISGFVFVKLINEGRNTNRFKPGKSFSLETTGGIASGILLSVLTSGLFNTYELLLVIILLFLAYAVLTFYVPKNGWKLAVKACFLILISAVIISEPDRFLRQLMLPAIKVTMSKDTPYGNITKGEYYGEQSIYYNQRLLTYHDDAMEREEDIHYAMLQREKHESVLLISGSPRSHLPEILKYDVKKIVYVERDPELAASARSEITGSIEKLVIENEDAFRYIRGGGESFDAIIMLLPPPSTLSVNRFYTVEFFKNAKIRMVPGGVFMCSPGPNDNYFNQESVNLYSSIYNSLAAVFTHILPVAGNKLYFIASDDELSVSFCHLTEVREIENVYVSKAFLSDDLTVKKSAEVRALMDKEIRQNRSAFPIACFHFQSYNFSRNLNEKIPAIILIIIAFVIPVLAVRRRNVIMYFSASALAGFEIIILLSLQLTVGNMYQITGLAIAAMMAGLAAGAGTGKIFAGKHAPSIQAFILIIYYLALALCFNLILTFKGIFAPVIIILLTVVIPSWMTGHIFRELTEGNSDPSGAGATYSADLAGSALGFILISGIAVPAFGIRNSIILLSMLIFTGLLFGTKRNKQ